MVAMPSAVWIVCALVACGCAAGAVVLHAPRERDWDDDGARV